MINYFKSVGLVLLLEFITIIIGFYYIFTRRVSKTIKLYIYFITFTLTIEILALYTAVGYFSDYKYFAFIQDTPFVSNFWLYNIFGVLFTGFILYYFGRLLTVKRSVYVLLGLGVIYTLSSLLVFIFIDDIFFSQISAYVTIAGALLLFISVSFYLIELLKGSLVLKGQNKFPLFVVVSTGIYQLAILPLLIYSFKYHNSGDQGFIELYMKALQIINVIVYLIIISGFFVCLSKKRT